MQDIISSIKKSLEENNCSVARNGLYELMIKARAIDILKEQANLGVGFAIEAIGRIAASSAVRSASLEEGRE